MLEEDIDDDAHLCIKCSSTIVGLDNYVQHRKNNCQPKNSIATNREIVHIDHAYENFDFQDSNSYHKTEEAEKVNKSLSESYDLPYDLGADVFFSSLQLQSSTKRLPSNPTPSTSGKHCPNRGTRKLSSALNVGHEQNDAWIGQTDESENLMKAVRDISGNKKCESIFKLITFNQTDEDQTDEDDVDDEDYDSIQSAAHTGGKWKSENLSASNQTLLRNSPAWDEQQHWEIANKLKDVNDEEEHDINPPPTHTRGKWIPGSKVIKLDYKENVEIGNIFSDQFWCNICNRKLSSKIVYERHLKTRLHLNKAKPEQELEQSAIPIKTFSVPERIRKPSEYLNADIYVTKSNSSIKKSSTIFESKNKRKRSKYYIKCNTCRTRLPKHLFGKHLISHYHYRHMSRDPLSSYNLIFENIEKIVYQSPFQCQTCHFYTNTVEDFMLHWMSDSHRKLNLFPGLFWCQFCKFECETNIQMEYHLRGSEHNEVVMAINRSVPIIITKKIKISCNKCNQVFRYNIELRKHAEKCTKQPIGTASNEYQSKFVCNICKKICKSRLSLQKHQINKHKIKKYYCSVCEIKFNSPIEAKKHRSTVEHKIISAKIKQSKTLCKKCRICGAMLQDILKLKKHLNENHPEEKYTCPHCNESFVLPQEVGRHIRYNDCQTTTTDLKVVELSSSADAVLSLLCLSSPNTPSEIQAQALLESVQTPLEKNLLQNQSAESTTSFTCSKCLFKTRLHAELLYHEILHGYKSIDKNFKIPCSVCDKKFRKSSLRCHLRQHTDEKIFPCEKCNQRFSRKHNLKMHVINKHSISKSTKSYPCKKCGKTFLKSQALAKHNKSYKDHNQKYVCPIEGCSYVGKKALCLKQHLTVHSNGEIFKCKERGSDYEGKQ